MSWSISIAERALPLGPLDNWLFHRDASHGFICVKNDKSETVLELHGCAQSHFQGKHAGMKHSMLLAFAFAADTLLGRPGRIGPSLHVKALTVSESMRALSKGRPLYLRETYRGSEEDVKRRVECALRAAEEINHARIRYVFFAFNKGGGINCHSVEAELWDRMFGVNPESSTRFANPGLAQDLEVFDPALTKIRPDRKSSFAAVSQSIQRIVSAIDVDTIASSLSWISSSSSPARAFAASAAQPG